MKVSVDSESSAYTLSEAVLIYKPNNNQLAPYITCHNVFPPGQPGMQPQLGEARPVTARFLTSLRQSLSPARREVEFLPENVLAATSDLLMWWVPAQRRPMYFAVAGENAAAVEKLSGKMFPQPPLVFRSCRRSLAVRALGRNMRPTLETDLLLAPYWNVSAGGEVCLGSMKHPKSQKIGSIPEWMDGFFDSYFTHPNTPLLTSHKAGLVDLWGSLADSGVDFPIKKLVPAKQNLAAFLEGKHP